MKNSQTKKNHDNETEPTPGKLHPFALQLSSVPAYVSFSRQLPKLSFFSFSPEISTAKSVKFLLSVSYFRLKETKR